MTTSIGPLANPDYYLRMQRSHQAANGYYTGGGEPDGIWWNPAGLLGLQHGATVGTDAFYRLCEGFSPDGEKLTQNAGSGKRSAGLDLTFSADKSVSAVWAVAGERLRTAIADAHTAAVQYTLKHVIEAHCATTRIRTRGLSGARGELAIVPSVDRLPRGPPCFSRLYHRQFRHVTRCSIGRHRDKYRCKPALTRGKAPATPSN